MPGQTSCARCAIGADGLDDIVPELVFAAVDDEALPTALANQGTTDSGLVDQVRADEEALEELARDYYVDRAISKGEFTAARTRLEARLEANRSKLARERSVGSARSFAGQGSSLRAAWPSASLHQRQAVIATVLDHVRIDPPTLKDVEPPSTPRGVVPVWRY